MSTATFTCPRCEKNEVAVYAQNRKQRLRDWLREAI